MAERRPLIEYELGPKIPRSARLGTTLLVSLFVGIVIGAISSFYWGTRDRATDRRAASAEIATLLRSAAALERERDNLRSALAKSQSELLALQEHSSASDDELVVVKKKNSELNSRVGLLDKRVKSLTEQLNRLNQGRNPETSRKETRPPGAN